MEQDRARHIRCQQIVTAILVVAFAATYAAEQRWPALTGLATTLQLVAALVWVWIM